jgi:hypothetical protein
MLSSESAQHILLGLYTVMTARVPPTWYVLDGQLLVLNVEHNVCHLIHGHHLSGSKVERLAAEQGTTKQAMYSDGSSA